VLVVAEVRLYREGLSEALAREPQFTVVGASADANVVGLAREGAVQVIVCDTSVEGAFRLFHELRAASPEPRIVALGVRDDEDDIAACAAAGVSGFVSRDARFDELVRTITAVARGESACSPAILAKLLLRVAALAPVEPTGVPLTMREREILDLVDRGLSNKEIAERLSIELSTVKNHVHNVLDKLQVRRRSDAVAFVRRREASTIHAVVERN
jgi:DNA-binding NarL/FixJ family response regulator